MTKQKGYNVDQRRDGGLLNNKTLYTEYYKINKSIFQTVPPKEKKGKKLSIFASLNPEKKYQALLQDVSVWFLNFVFSPTIAIGSRHQIHLIRYCRSNCTLKLIITQR
uniref:Uncharacterized protein n=1 Tax=Octopus bimaculoides TaxID=37653 RepID=A0A0L8I2J8_OCTBM